MVYMFFNLENKTKIKIMKEKNELIIITVSTAVGTFLAYTIFGTLAEIYKQKKQKKYAI